MPDSDATNLVLSRRENETIHIGDDIRIKVIRTRSNQVRFLIMAPLSIRVRRGEIVDRDRNLESALPLSQPLGGFVSAGSSHERLAISIEM